MNPDSKKAAKINEGAIMKALDWGYDKSVNGLPGVDSAIELAEDYMKVGGTKNSQVTSLIRWQLSKAGTSGFLTGFGGLITMPITIPANLASVMFIQIRMIAAIAHIGGYDLKDDRVKSLVYACMAGNAAKDILKDIGIVIGTKLTTQAIKSISGKTLVAINQRVGFRLLTKFGSKGAINLGKAVPIIGGIVGGTFDVVTTNIIGNVAKKAFIDSIEESKKNWWEVPVVQLDQSVKELEQQTAKWSQQPKDDSQKEEITEDINSTYSFSLFPNLLTAEHPDDNIDINQLYDMIKDGYVKDKISKLRYAINDKEEYTRIKKELLPAVTLSGTFNHRNAEGLIEHSGLLQVDIDHVEDVDELFKTICEDYYTYMCFRSPGGQGIKVVVKINPSVESHKQQFFAIERYYHDQFDIDIDKSCKDTARCMLLSYDPNIYCNPEANVFEELYEPKENKPTSAPKEPSTTSHAQHSEDKRELIENITKALEAGNIDITDSYDKWIRIGYVLSNVLGMDGLDYFLRISAMHTDFTPEESEKKFKLLADHNSGQVKLGTLVYYAKEAGVTINYGEPKKLQTAEPSKEEEQSDLLAKLKERRLKVAKQKGIAPYMVFKDETLELLAERTPANQQEFMEIPGISYQSMENNAKYFLPLIRKHLGIKGPLKLIFDESHARKKDIKYNLSESDKVLYEELRKLRTRLAKEEGFKPYYIFSNKVLNDLVRFKPKNFEDLMRINGIGQQKADWFGKEVIEIMNNY